MADDPSSPRYGARQDSTFTWFVIALLLGILAVGAVALIPRAEPKQRHRLARNLNERLTDGMTLAVAVQIIGFPPGDYLGRVISPFEVECRGKYCQPDAYSKTARTLSWTTCNGRLEVRLDRNDVVLCADFCDFGRDLRD
jgi:hypothetical protein